MIRMVAILLDTDEGQFLSSSLLCMRASRILLVSFVPLCYPWRMLMLVTTFFHPASLFSLTKSALTCSSFLRLSVALYLFSCSFWSLYCSSWPRPSSCLFFFSSHSWSWMNIDLHFFTWAQLVSFPIIIVFYELPHPLQNHWSHYHSQHYDYCSEVTNYSYCLSYCCYSRSDCPHEHHLYHKNMYRFQYLKRDLDLN